MAPLIIGADPIGPEALMIKLDAHLQGHPYAKSPIDMALWDLTAQIAKLPLYKLLGGACQADMPLYHSITCIAPDDMARIASDAYHQGIQQFQVKLGADQDWQADVERLRLVRDAVGAGPLVYGDWNCGASSSMQAVWGERWRILISCSNSPAKQCWSALPCAGPLDCQ